MSMRVRKFGMVLGLTALVSTAFVVSSEASLPKPLHQAEEDESLGLQMARRMVVLGTVRPLPSLGYQLSARMLRRQQSIENQQKSQKLSGKRAVKRLPILPTS